MARRIFVNLAVADLDRAVKFFTALGFSFNPDFTDETATCMIIDDDMFVMLLTREKFAGFTPNGICDTRTANEALLALSLDDRAEVDELVAKAVAAGGRTYSEPQDHGFMYGHGFQDPDGHVWEVFHMNMPEDMPEGTPQ